LTVRLLRKIFPGQPQLAYFELAATRSLDPGDVNRSGGENWRGPVNEIDPAELSEKTGYRLKLRDYPLTPLAKAPVAGAGTETETKPVENEI